MSYRYKFLFPVLLPLVAGTLISCGPSGKGPSDTSANSWTQEERAQLSRTLEFIRASGLSSTAEPDCKNHPDDDEFDITCEVDDQICWCDPPDTVGGECRCEPLGNPDAGDP